MREPLGPDRIRDIVGSLAPVVGYPRPAAVRSAFADLAARHPDVVTSRRVGTSRLGEPLMVTTIGSGTVCAVVVAGVHPNEAVGFETELALARLLVERAEVRDDLDCTWHILENLDPDGAALNEAWFDVPGDRDAYSRHFYRPAPELQPEWTFPTSYKQAYFDRMLPETVALARLIDELQPAFYVSLHNSETGGAYWYLGDEDAALAPQLADLARQLGVPVDQGEPESPHLVRFAPGVFRASTFAADYDAEEQVGGNPAAGFVGSSATEYAARRGARTLIPEVPYWTPVDDDVRDTDETYAAMLQRTAADMGEIAAVLDDILRRADPCLSVLSPFAAAARAFIPMMVADAAADSDRAGRERSVVRPASTAETQSRETRVRGFVLRYGGMLRRAIDVEVAAGVADVELRSCKVLLDAIFEEWLARPGVAVTTLDPTRLVGVQLGSILALADRVVGERRVSG